MAINVRTGVAPSGGVARIDPFALAENFSKQMGYAGVPNPAQSIQETVNAVPELPPAPPIDPQMFVNQGGAVQSPEDVARLSGSPYNPAAVERPVLDENGLPVIQGDRAVTAPISMDEYNQQLNAVNSQTLAITDPVKQIAADPYNSVDAVADLLDASRETTENRGNARAISKAYMDGKETRRLLDGIGSDIGNAVKSMERALFSSEGKARAGEDEIGRVLTPGAAVLAKSGITDLQTAQVISTIGGMAFNQAVTQMGVRTKAAKRSGEEEESNAPEGTEYMADAINSVAHFFKGGLRNVGVELDPADVEYLSKAAIYDAVARRDLLGSHDPTGRPIVESSPDLKRQAMRLQRVADAMTGIPTRGMSSTTPTASGALMGRRGPKLTRKSVYLPEFVTKAADMSKNIFGSVAYVFRAKDFQRKQAELDLVFHPDNVQLDENTGEFMFSRHPFASRNGVDENAFETAKARVQPPEGVNPNDPNFKAFTEEAARKVMETKRQDILFTMESLKNKTGLRYAEFKHSLANQRFFVNSFDLDYMGSKNVIRDIMAMAYQDPVRVDMVFDPNVTRIVQEKAAKIFNTKDGMAIHRGLTELSPSELGALGAMHNAVLYYYSALDKSIPNIARLSLGEVISFYTPEVGEKLADLGFKYNQWLQDPSQELDSEVAGLWSSTEKGEALGSLNLWDDFFKARSSYLEPGTKRGSIAMSHHGFYDGNQNGIFLQALFFGMPSMNSNSDALLRLGAGSPSLSDLRVHGMETMLHNQREYLKDSPEKSEAWETFWTEAARLHPAGMDGVAKDFFKAPLMQAAYGKDASMFKDVLFEVMEGNKMYSDLASKHLVPLYNSKYSAAVDMGHNVEQTLRQIIDSSSVWMMKRIGRNFSLLNRPMIFEGITGDTYVISPVGVVPINMYTTTDNKNVTSMKLDNGQTAFLKRPQRVADQFTNTDTGEVVSIESSTMGFRPTFSKGRALDPTGMSNVESFLNRSTMVYDKFHNPLGISQGSQAAVLTIQSLDGDLVKWTSIMANRGLKIPRPVTWVHDSIISTPGQALVYTNMYNNVAIPEGINEIKKLGGKIQKALDKARQATIDWVELNNAAVGIGSEGEFPALGALFDEIYGKYMTDDDSYKTHFIRTRIAQGDSESKANKKWEEKKKAHEDVIKEAKEYGYATPDELRGPNRKYMAIPPAAFKHLLKLAENTLFTNGPQNKMHDFTKNFADRVTNAQRTLLSAATKGIKQMGGSAAKRGKPVAGVKKVPMPAKTKPVEVDPASQLVPDVDDPFSDKAMAEFYKESGQAVPAPREPTAPRNPFQGTDPFDENIPFKSLKPLR